MITLIGWGTAMFDSDFKEADWIEFSSPVWAGLKHGYVNGVGLRIDGPDRTDRPVCKKFVRDDEGWWIVMSADCAVMVSHNNVRFVVYRCAESVAAETQNDHEGEISSQVVRDVDEGTHAVNATALPIDFTNIPKRRGRPPKDPRVIR